MPPPSFQHANGFKMGLHWPGHLGWWSPPPQGPGRSLELRLEGNTQKTVMRERNFFFFFLIRALKWLPGLRVINRLSALCEIKKENIRIRSFPRKELQLPVDIVSNVRMLPNVRLPTRAASGGHGGYHVRANLSAAE